MRTIPRHWHGRINGGTANCDVCGVRWPRAKLRRDGEGNLICPDEGRGLDGTTLDRLNAEMGRPWPMPRPDSTPERERPRPPDKIFGALQTGWWTAESVELFGENDVQRMPDMTGNGHDLRYVRSATFDPPLLLNPQAIGGHPSVSRGTMGEAAATAHAINTTDRVSLWAVMRFVLLNTQTLTLFTAGSYLLQQRANEANASTTDGFTQTCVTTGGVLNKWYRLLVTWWPESRIKLGSEEVTGPGLARTGTTLRSVLSCSSTVRRMGEVAEWGFLVGDHAASQEAELDAYIADRYRGEVQL